MSPSVSPRFILGLITSLVGHSSYHHSLLHRRRGGPSAVHHIYPLRILRSIYLGLGGGEGRGGLVNASMFIGTFKLT